tara:strand:- start:334 stop:852 length:519 start_codon:yes stop_codon:yes gene_type:complete
MSKFHNNWRTFINEQQLSDYESQYEPGKIRLFHYTSTSRAQGADRFIVDPQFFLVAKFRGSYSQNEWIRSQHPRSFYYLDPEDKEIMIGRELYYVDVPAERIYNLRQDPAGYYKKWVEKSPYGRLRDGMEWTGMLKDIADSYSGVYYTLGPDGAPVVAYFDPLEAEKVEESS